MMFLHAFLAFGIYLIALSLAGILMIFSRVHKDVSCIGCQIIAYIVLIFSLMGIIGTGYYKLYMLQHGYLTPSPCPMTKIMMQNKMMNGEMK